MPRSQGATLKANLVVRFIARALWLPRYSHKHHQTNKQGSSCFEAEKNKLPQMPHNFMTAIDHIYEGLIKLQTVLIQKGSYNNAEGSIITSWWQLYYCCGPILYRVSSTHKLSWSEAAQQAGVLLYKIYFLWDTVIISNGSQNVWELQDLLRYHNRDISFMFTGNDNKCSYLGRETDSHNSYWDCWQSTVAGDWQRWNLVWACHLMGLSRAWHLRTSGRGRDLTFTSGQLWQSGGKGLLSPAEGYLIILEHLWFFIKEGSKQKKQQYNYFS